MIFACSPSTGLRWRLAGGSLFILRRNQPRAQDHTTRRESKTPTETASNVVGGIKSAGSSSVSANYLADDLLTSRVSGFVAAMNILL